MRWIAFVALVALVGCGKECLKCKHSEHAGSCSHWHYEEYGPVHSHSGIHTSVGSKGRLSHSFYTYHHRDERAVPDCSCFTLESTRP